MNFYDVDILDTKSGETKRCPMLCGWMEGEDGSIEMWRTKMCDCNLGGYHARLQYKDSRTGEVSWAQHSFSAEQFVKACGDHSMPPKRFIALKAYLRDGRVIDLQEALAKAA
jgi:hypothetical protein